MTYYYHPARDLALAHAELRNAFPEDSIPAAAPLDEGSMRLLGLALLLDAPMPSAEPGCNVVRGVIEPLPDGTYRQWWHQVPWAEEEAGAARKKLIGYRLQGVEVELVNRSQRFSYDFGEGWGIHQLQIRDADDKANWLTLQISAMQLQAAGVDEAVLEMRTESNEIIPRTPSQVLTALSEMVIYGQRCLATSWRLKDSIRSASDPATIDITKGWPA